MCNELPAVSLQIVKALHPKDLRCIRAIVRSFNQSNTLIAPFVSAMLVQKNTITPIMTESTFGLPDDVLKLSMPTLMEFAPPGTLQHLQDRHEPEFLSNLRTARLQLASLKGTIICHSADLGPNSGSMLAHTCLLARYRRPCHLW